MEENRPPPVRPRVHSGDETLLLTDVIDGLLVHGCEGEVLLQGPPGSGKRTAIALLAEHFASEPRLVFARVEEGEAPLRGRLRVRAIRVLGSLQTYPGAQRYSLAPWGEDEWLEYLMGRHRTRVGPVLELLAADPGARPWLALPATAVLVLDRLARGEAHDARTAMRLALAELDPTGAARERLGVSALAGLERQPLEGVPRALHRLSRIPNVRRLLAFDALRAALTRGELRLLPSFLGEVELQSVRGDEAGWQEAVPTLLRCLSREHSRRAVSAASLLHHLGAPPEWHERLATCPPLDHVRLPGFRHRGLGLPGASLRYADLREAHLRRVDLAGAQLERAHFDRADLGLARLTGVQAERISCAAADLRHAGLRGARLSRGRFTRARLAGADLREADLTSSDLSGADLRGADLRSALLLHARLHGARLERANLSQAVLRETDLRSVSLAGARLRQADLHRARLTGVVAEGLELSGADLGGAELSGSRLGPALLTGANLCGAFLAEVDWEGADLFGADLRHATFHFGSTRSGLLAGAPPSWGTRTGFYVDDLVDLARRRPEEVRRANLCRVDLRRAELTGADFYLVDLRGARFTPAQERHLRANGAILDS